METIREFSVATDTTKRLCISIASCGMEEIHPKDTPELIRWKKLCIKELDWCQSNQDEIERLANELYRIYSSDEPFGKRNICLNFPALERECNKAK